MPDENTESTEPTHIDLRPLLPVLLLTFLAQRHIVTGLTFGGVEK